MAAFRIIRRLRDLLDFTLGSPSDGDRVTYDAATGGFILEAASGGGGAPTDADYLVGTANGGLSAEIVVGASPGGELGGTWAVPTVDATHSGSSHAAVQAAAEATAAAALSAYAQPLDSDLTAIAALTTTAYGRAFLALADAAAARAAVGLAASAVPFTPAGSIAATDVQAAIVEVAAEAGVVSPHAVSMVRTPILQEVTGNAAFAAANGATFMLFEVIGVVSINRIVVNIGSSSGNVDEGIYASDGTAGAPLTRLVSSGSTACPAANAPRAITVGSTVLTRGIYWAAFASSDGLAQIGYRSSGFGDAAGMVIRYEYASSFPLPATLSGSGTPATANAALILPFGV